MGGDRSEGSFPAHMCQLEGVSQDAPWTCPSEALSGSVDLSPEHKARKRNVSELLSPCRCVLGSEVFLPESMYVGERSARHLRC